MSITLRAIDESLRFTIHKCLPRLGQPLRHMICQDKLVPKEREKINTTTLARTFIILESLALQHTYSSPNSTTVTRKQVNANVRLGEGYVRSCSATDTDSKNSMNDT